MPNNTRPQQLERKQPSKQILNLVDGKSSLPEKLELPIVFAKTVKSFFPKLGKNMRAIEDPRMVNKINYELNLLVWVGIFMFFLS